MEKQQDIVIMIVKLNQFCLIDICKTASIIFNENEINCFYFIPAIIIAYYMINLIVGLIAGPILTKRNRDGFITRLSQTDSLGGMCDIISDIVTRFDGYVLSKPKNAVDVSDIVQLMKNIETYQKIKNLNILKAYVYEDHIHFCMEELQSHLVEKIELPAKVVESTAVEESEIHFSNWSKPVCIKKYIK